MSIKKKIIKIIIAIVLIITAVIISIIAVKSINESSRVKQIEEKLSNINAEELKTKLIEKLKESAINIESSENQILTTTTFSDTNDKYQGFVTGTITQKRGGSIVNVIYFPCFKIQNDNNGNFKTIEFISGAAWFGEIFIEDAIREVLNSEYGINIGEQWENPKFHGFKHNPQIIGKETSITYDDDMLTGSIIKSINKDYTSDNLNVFISILKRKEKSQIWGCLDSEK